LSLEISNAKLIDQDVHALVIPSNPELQMQDGLSREVFEAAGKETLQKACDSFAGVEYGQAAITMGYGLDQIYVIHAPIPPYAGVDGEREMLQAIYASVLRLAAAHDCLSIALPLLGVEGAGYPKEMDLAAVKDAIEDFFVMYVMDIILVIDA